jgi:hypothetical protein
MKSIFSAPLAPISSTYTVMEITFYEGNNRQVLKFNGTNEDTVARKAESITEALGSPEWIGIARAVNTNPQALAELYAWATANAVTDNPPADKVRSTLTYVTTMVPTSCYITDRRAAVTAAFSGGSRKSNAAADLASSVKRPTALNVAPGEIPF